MGALVLGEIGFYGAARRCLLWSDGDGWGEHETAGRSPKLLGDAGTCGVLSWVEVMCCNGAPPSTRSLTESASACRASSSFNRTRGV